MHKKLILLVIIMSSLSCNSDLKISYNREFSPLSDQLFGYGTMFATFVPDGEKKSYIDYQPLVDITAKLPNQILRFPGGTDAHFYDWDKESVVDIKDIHHPGMKKNLKRSKGMKFTLGDFLDFCHKVGAKPTITLPVYQNDSQYVIDLVAKIKADYPNQEFPMWELGNEHGLELSWKKKKLSSAEYISTCRPIGQYIMEQFPNSLVAVTAEGYLKRGRAKEWNSSLANANKMNSFFNAVVVHKYLYFPKKAIDLSVEDKANLLFAGTTLEAKKAVKVGQEYFQGLPLLMTEVGVAGVEMKNPDQAARAANETQLHPHWWLTELGNLDYMLAYMEESKNHPFYAILRHMLIVKNQGKLGRAVLQWEPTQNKKQPNIKQGWNVVSHSLLEVILDNFEGGEYTMIPYNKEKVDCNILKYKDTSYSPLRIAIFKKDGKRGFFILNKTNKEYTIELGKGSWAMQSISNNADALPPGFGPKDHLIVKGNKSGKIKVKPYSFNIGLQ